MRILRVAPGRLLAFVSGAPPTAPSPGRLRLVSGDSSGHAAAVVRALSAVAGESDDDTRVMILGRGNGGAAAAAASIFHFTEITPLTVKNHLTSHGIAVRKTE